MSPDRDREPSGVLVVKEADRVPRWKGAIATAQELLDQDREVVRSGIDTMIETVLPMPDGSTRQLAVHVVHDLPHLVVESLFGIEDGLWGVLARGGFSAANRALEQAGFRLVSAGLKYCISNPDQAEADGYPLGEVEKMFMRLA